MIRLAIDTATDRAAVAAGGAAGVHRATLHGARQHARALPGLLDDVLAAAGAHRTDVRGVVVADGPGSFTGLRVGAAVAKALVRALGVPLWTAPSLLARAWSAAPRDGSLVVVISDALRGDLYAAAWRLRPDVVETIVAPTVLRAPDVLARCGRPDFIVSGADPAALATVRGGSGVPAVEGEAALPDAAALLELSHVAGGARRVGDVAGWEPVYGRPAEAQARWEEAHGRPLPHPAGPVG